MRRKLAQQSGPSDARTQRKFTEQLVKAFELSGDIVYGSVLMSITGREEVLVENYRGILEYQENHIRIQAKECRILFVGRNLQIEYYTSDEMKIKGLLEQIIYEN